MSNLLRDKILSINDHSLTPVEVPEWECTVFIRSWTGIERNRVTRAWQRIEKHPEELDSVYGLVLTLSLCDEEGNKLFNDKDITQLLSHKSAILEKLVMGSLKANGVSADAVEEAKKN